MASGYIPIFFGLISTSIYAIPMCPIPIDKRFPATMHVDGETMCPNGCCNWTIDGCCPGSHVIPQDQLSGVESPDIIYHGADWDLVDDRHGHDHDRRKRRHVEEFTDDEFVEDEDENDDFNTEESSYLMGFRILGIVVVVVGLLNLAYPDHLRV